MSLSVTAVPPVAPLSDPAYQFHQFATPAKLDPLPPPPPAPPKPTPIEQLETLEAAGKSVAQIAATLGLTPDQVDAELGVVTSTATTVIPQAIDIKA